MRINRKTPKNPSNSKCLVWRDLILEGDINLGQICTKIDHTIPFDEADSFCKVIFSFIMHIKMADQKELIHLKISFIFILFHLQEELDASLFNLNNLFPTLDFAKKFINLEMIKK